MGGQKALKDYVILVNCSSSQIYLQIPLATFHERRTNLTKVFLPNDRRIVLIMAYFLKE